MTSCCRVSGGRDVSKDSSDVILRAQAVLGPWNEETAFPRKVCNHSRKHSESCSRKHDPLSRIICMWNFANILSVSESDKKATISNVTGVFRFEIICSIKNSVSFRFSGLYGFVNILKDCTDKILRQIFCLTMYWTNRLVYYFVSLKMVQWQTERY